LLAAELESPGDLVSFNRTISSLQSEDGIAAVRPAFPNRDGSAALAIVFPETSPQSVETRHLIDRLRTDVLPAAEAGGAPDIVVAVFQWGWLKDVIGVERTGPIEAFLPMMLFAILFGLSMDYEVFLLSRIREEYLKTRRNDIAVADGLAATAGVITAAAAIMVTVFLSFMLGDQREIKLFGLGLAVAIFLDATVIRMVVVPATMELFGEANWWLPRWLDRLLPRVSVESEHVDPDVTPVEVAPVEADVAAPTSATRRPTSKAKPKAPARKAKAKPKAAASKAKAKSKPKTTAKPAARNRARPS
jgi:RND superfamily putative drug exporter